MQNLSSPNVATTQKASTQGRRIYPAQTYQPHQKQAPRGAGFILPKRIDDTKQKIKTKTGSLKAASQSQKHTYDDANIISTNTASTQGRRIHPA